MAVTAPQEPREPTPAEVAKLVQDKRLAAGRAAGRNPDSVSLSAADFKAAGFLPPQLRDINFNIDPVAPLEEFRNTTEAPPAPSTLEDQFATPILPGHNLMPSAQTLMEICAVSTTLSQQAEAVFKGVVKIQEETRAQLQTESDEEYARLRAALDITDNTILAQIRDGIQRKTAALAGQRGEQLALLRNEQLQIMAARSEVMAQKATDFLAAYPTPTAYISLYGIGSTVRNSYQQQLVGAGESQLRNAMHLCLATGNLSLGAEIVNKINQLPSDARKRLSVDRFCKALAGESHESQARACRLIQNNHYQILTRLANFAKHGSPELTPVQKIDSFVRAQQAAGDVGRIDSDRTDGAVKSSLGKITSGLRDFKDGR